MADDPKPVAAELVPLVPAEVSQRRQADKNLDVIRRQDEKLRRRVSSMMVDYLGAADLNDDGTPVDPEAETETDGRPKGWSHRRYRIAKDGRKGTRDAPGYLRDAVRVHDSYQRRDTAPKAPQLNVDVQVAIVSPAGQAVVRAGYRVIDVDDGGETK